MDLRPRLRSDILRWPRGRTKHHGDGRRQKSRRRTSESARQGAQSKEFGSHSGESAEGRRALARSWCCGGREREVPPPDCDHDELNMIRKLRSKDGVCLPAKFWSRRKLVRASSYSHNFVPSLERGGRHILDSLRSHQPTRTS